MVAIVQPGGVIDAGIASSDAGSRLLRYDPREVHLIWGGLPCHVGIAAGTFITAERNVPSWRLVKGTDGEGTRVRTMNFSARVQLTLRRGTWVNDVLSAASASDDLSGVFTVPLFLNDKNGRSLYTSPIAFVESPTDPSFSDQEGSNTWVFICDTWLPFSGGLERAKSS